MSAAKSRACAEERTENGTGPISWFGNDLLELEYDKVGNITTQDTSATTITYTHDAWNRLVGVEYGQTVRGSYVYNGLNWRIMKQADTDGTAGPDQQRLMHDSAAPGNAPGMWQLLEEDVWDDWSEQTPGDIDRHVQYVWGDRYSSEIGDCPELIDRHVQYVWGDRCSSEIGDCPELIVPN